MTSFTGYCIRISHLILSDITPRLDSPRLCVSRPSNGNCSVPNHYLFNLCHPELVKGHFINPFMSRAPGDYSFDPLATRNISKVVKLTYSWPMHLNILLLTFCTPWCHQEYINLLTYMSTGNHDVLSMQQDIDNITNTLSWKRNVIFDSKVKTWHTSKTGNEWVNDCLKAHWHTKAI